MPRDVSASFKQAVFAPQTDQVFVVLVKIDHAQLGAPIRLCSDAANVTSNGETYLAYPFYLALPLDTENEPPRCRIAIDNVARDLVQAVREINDPATVTLRVVRAGAPDTVEAQWSELQMINVRYDAFVIEAELNLENYLGEPYPQHKFTPSGFPGLFL